MTATLAAQLGGGLDLETVLGLYRGFAPDLARVRRYQRLLYESRFDPAQEDARLSVLAFAARELWVRLTAQRGGTAQLDDLAAELSYLLLREHRPAVTVEISPCGGWSTTWILNALRDNAQGRLESYDMVDAAGAKVPADLATGIWHLHLGDVRRSERIPARIDYLFLDADHSAAFAEWYIAELFPRVSPGGIVSVDDVFCADGPDSAGGEGTVVLRWLEQRGIPWFTLSPHADPVAHAAVSLERARLGLDRPIHEPRTNPTLFFVMP